MSVYTFGPFQLDPQRLLLTHRGDPVALGPKVVETLLALVEHPGEVMPKAALLERVWPDGFVEEANLSQNVHVLRKTFRGYGFADPIATVPRRGYRFTAAIERRSEASSDLCARPTAWAPSMLRRRAAAAGTAVVAASLLLALTSLIGQRGLATPPAQAKVTRLYEVGRYYWNLRTRDGVERSLRYFAQLIDADPNDARGYAVLADANIAMGEYCYGPHDPAVYYDRAREYARKAIALDPNSAEAHAALGVLALEGNDRGAALRELRLAIERRDDYGPAHEWYGIALVESGRLGEGIGELTTANRLEPSSVATAAWLALALYRDRRFPDAIRFARHALELAPQRTDALATLGEAYEARGELDRAIDSFARYGAVGRYYRPEAAALLAHAYARAGRLGQAQAELRFARSHPKDVDPLDVAAAEAAVRGSARALPDRRSHGSLYA